MWWTGGKHKLGKISHHVTVLHSNKHVNQMTDGMLHFTIYPNRAKHNKYKVAVLLAKPVLLRVEGVMCLSKHLLLGLFFLSWEIPQCWTESDVHQCAGSC